MRKVLFVLIALFLATGSSLLALQVTAGEGQAGESDKILEFDTRVGLPRPFTGGEGSAIRGVDGGGLPWAVARAEGDLETNGDIEVKV